MILRSIPVFLYAGLLAYVASELYSVAAPLVGVVQ